MIHSLTSKLEKVAETKKKDDLVNIITINVPYIQLIITKYK